MTDNNFLEMFGQDWPTPQAAMPEEIPIAALDDPLERFKPATAAADETIAFLERAQQFQEMTGMSEIQAKEFMKSAPQPAAPPATASTHPVERTDRNRWLRLANERYRAKKEGRLAQWQAETGLP